LAEGAGDRTEAASPRRLEKAREDGNVAVSREFSMFASLGAGILTAASEAGGTGMQSWLSRSLQAVHADPAARAAGAAGDLLAVAAPVWLAAAGGFAAATLIQTGFLLHLAALKPDILRISPMRGLKRVAGIDTASTAAKAIVKLGALACGLFFALRRLIPILVQAPHWQPSQLLHQLLAQSWNLLLPLLGMQAAVALLDLLWVRFQHAKKLRMSRQELRDEHKESEGNPQVKQRLRQLARTRAKRRMMAAVPKAAVVVTNPTHYAVALAYERGARGAPRVVAKGADEVAAKIREMARESRVPIVANPPLARALYRIELDTEIPAEHFKAVAELIAYIWRMRSRVGRL
jgi:flagellar biosynthetic protein FlhB